MKQIMTCFFIVAATSTTISNAHAQSFGATEYPVYTGNYLGVNYTLQRTTFKIWSPKASAVVLRLYAAGQGGSAFDSLQLGKAADGVWQLSINKDIKNTYYTLQVTQDGKQLLERPDIYARAVGVNGARGLVADMKETDPASWANDKKPPLANFTDIVLYEMHLRDLAMSLTSGIKNKGKFLELTERGTKSPEGEMTGLDHIKQLGVTHVHLLPLFDFNSVDETKPEANRYNWGYDPLNYNVPEGSYATNAYDGNTRIKEFKQMVQALHANGLRLIMDVVYNHTSSLQANFDEFVPGYFYRHNANGSYSDATGCGNETASEREMMRRYMISSVVYWAKEYHIDGFRFDLMGVHDIETMNQISVALHKIDPTIFIYGEGWTAGGSPFPEPLRAVKKNASQLNKVAVFDDDMRDGIKGSYSDVKSKGYVSGATGNTESVKFGIVGCVKHPQIDYTKVNYSKEAWAASPAQSINYVSCHDDNTLYDKLKIANPNASEKELEQMDKLSNAIVLTSQGVPFLQAGAEMLGTKQGVGNSYNSPDSINQLDWTRKTKYKDVFNYYQGLIALRKDHPAFRMPTAALIAEHLKFINTGNEMVIAYELTGHANKDEWNNIIVVFNGSAANTSIALPPGKWHVAVDRNKCYGAGGPNISSTLEVAGISAYVLCQQ